MTEKCQKIKIAHTKYDRRIKLTESDRAKIIELSKDGMGKMKIAEMFNVSKRTIQFIVNPLSLEENKLRRSERGGAGQYYDKEKNTEVKREHRDYKRSLFISGEIKIE